LSSWDIVILDPLQQGVLDAIATIRPAGAFSRVGRLYLPDIHSPKHQPDEQDIVLGVEKVRSVLEKGFDYSRRQSSSFTGVLLAGWEDWLPIPVFDALTRYLSSTGLDVYLEIAPPDFLSKVGAPNMENFAGVVVRNGTILPTGDVRDYFQMAVMKSAVKAFVTQTCLREFKVMVWETIDDRISLSHAVTKRCYMWCRYYSAMVFIGSKASLQDAAICVGVPEPLAAFQWLKDQRVMKIHNKWRSTHKVCLGSISTSLRSRF
jgi:hypothetical protein